MVRMSFRCSFALLRTRLKVNSAGFEEVGGEGMADKEHPGVTRRKLEQ